MSDRAEKLEQASKRATRGPARCTLAQLRSTRWGRVTAPDSPRVGDEVRFEGMDVELWRVASVRGAEVDLERMSGGTT